MLKLTFVPPRLNTSQQPISDRIIGTQNVNIRSSDPYCSVDTAGGTVCIYAVSIAKENAVIVWSKFVILLIVSDNFYAIYCTHGIMRN